MTAKILQPDSKASILPADAEGHLARAASQSRAEEALLRAVATGGQLPAVIERTHFTEATRGDVWESMRAEVAGGATPADVLARDSRLDTTQGGEPRLTAEYAARVLGWAQTRAKIPAHLAANLASAEALYVEALEADPQGPAVASWGAFLDAVREAQGSPASLKALAKVYPGGPCGTPAYVKRLTEQARGAEGPEYLGLSPARLRAKVASMPPLWRIVGPFVEGESSLIAGDPGAGKTWFCLDLAMRVALGAEWQKEEWRPARPGKVLYLAGEDHERGMTARIDMLGRSFKDDGRDDLLEENLRIIAADTWPDGEAPDFTQPEAQEALLRHVAQERFALVVLDNKDTLSSCENENDAAPALALFQFIHRMCLLPHRPHVVLVAHANKGGTSVRGSNALLTRCSLAFLLSKIDPINGEARTKVTPHKTGRPQGDDFDPRSLSTPWVFRQARTEGGGVRLEAEAVDESARAPIGARDYVNPSARGGISTEHALGAALLFAQHTQRKAEEVSRLSRNTLRGRAAAWEKLPAPARLAAIKARAALPCTAEELAALAKLSEGLGAPSPALGGEPPKPPTQPPGEGLGAGWVGGSPFRGATTHPPTQSEPTTPARPQPRRLFPVPSKGGEK